MQDNADLGRIWCRFLERRGFLVSLATASDEALRALDETDFDALILEPMVDSGGLSVADFASFRNPDIQILAVTRSTFFSAGAILQMMPNARGVLRTPVRPEDLVAYLEHFGDRAATKVTAQNA